MNAAKEILAVDDNPTNLKLVTYLLSTQGYSVRVARSASEALYVLEGFPAKVILLDIQLPDLDGLELTKQLKTDPQSCHIRIVALTAYAMKGDEEKARAAGVDDYISKPIDKARLRQVVAQQLEKFAERVNDERNIERISARTIS